MNHRPLHGGRLRAASLAYGIPEDAWIDLSCALNPHPWPVPPLPPHIWQRLPEGDDGLTDAMQAYYGTPDVLPVPGSQSVISLLPGLWTGKRRVWVPRTGYQEHAWCWHKGGHVIVRYDTLPSSDVLGTGDIVVVIHPNNPLGHWEHPTALRDLIATLAPLDGLCIIDEAFIDATPERSVLHSHASANTIILRSFGKFFGLAGLRLGAMIANQDWRARVEAALPPWSINTPARWIGARALRDSAWHARARKELLAGSEAFCNSLTSLPCLREAYFTHTALFVTLSLPPAQTIALHTRLARSGILTRLFEEEGLLRLGLPVNSGVHQRVLDALTSEKFDGMHTAGS